MDKKQVLIVDDDALVRESLCRGLKLLGYEPVGFEKASEALDHIGNNGADVVVCDLFMPEMDGLEFLSILRKMQNRPRTVMISGGSTELGLPPSKYLQMARNMGADAVLKKPFSLSELEYVFGGMEDAAGGLKTNRDKGERT